MDSRSSEKTKLIAVVLIALFFGFLTGYYLELLLIALAGYILWSLDLLLILKDGLKEVPMLMRLLLAEASGIG